MTVDEARLRHYTVEMTDDPAELTITTDSRVMFRDHMGGDAAVIEAMLVSTEDDEVVQAMLEEKTTYGRINFLMKNRHGTPFEHNALKFFVAAPIMVFREFHRHRIGFSYNEMSGRYRQLPADFYVPPTNRPMKQVGKPGAYEYVTEDDPEEFQATINDLCSVYDHAYRAYERILARGHAKEIARACLPVAIFSEMYVTCNARSLMSFLSLRTKDPDSLFPSFPMWEIERVARAMEGHFAVLFPMTYRAFIENRRVAP